MSSEVNNLYEFGDFRFDAETNTLWREDKLVSLSPKALELLRVILEQRGEIVSKQAIFETVWQGSFVEEGVLTQNIYTLRKTLGTNENGNQIIENIARRGYRLNVPVKVLPKTNGNHDREVLSVILDEQAVLDEAAAKKLADQKPFYKRKSFVLTAFALVLLLSAGFFAKPFLRRQVWAYFHSPLENVRFQKLTDNGKTSFPTLSRDGDFMAYVRENAVFLKDLKSGKEIKLEISGAESFSSLQFSPDGDSIYFRNSETLRKNANSLKVSRFGGETTLVAEKIWGNFGVSPDEKKIAFVRKIDGSKKQILIVKNLDNGDEKELLTKEFPDFFFYRGTLSWSPDAAKIAFVANAGTERSTKLFVVDTETAREEEIKSPRLRGFEQAVWTADGGALIVSASEAGGRKLHLWQILYPSGDVLRITNGLENFGSLSISADGKKLLTVQTTETSNLWTADETNLSEQKQTTFGNSSNFGQTSLGWAGDEKIVFSASGETNAFSNLRILDTTSGAQQPLTANTNFHSDFAAVSREGKYVYFNANRNRLINVWRIETSGENLTQITGASAGLRLFPAISPDGNFLYYLFRSRDSAAVKRLNLAENKEEIFFENSAVAPAAFLSLSADGKRLAFMNLNGEIESDDEENNFQFAVVSTENPRDIRFFNVKTNAALARFSPDGKSLDYVSFSPHQSKIMRQTLEGGEPVEILNLPNTRIFNFAWTADGKRLAVSRGNQIRDAVLLTNFE